ncbi:glucosidase [Methylococcus sp. EFPC2]|uniref:MGH1-like glycoside hydrolase domain-containing protein n=1 Tax=Methylococcus sp. EFPC2 TaxID=2812648 RepID=UPI00196895F3|nr:glucosidase [Methylococcus sp. EFPC2]QSA97779.1 glucosidase [Methylococcus sp. EFPC2]
MLTSTREQVRLDEAREKKIAWKKWGPYLSERQWGTVREDYSDDGNAWSYFSHDQARSRAYKWGEDGIAGISDDRQGLCWSLAVWNGQDPIIKERLFGLTNAEGNHGEDVKEYYFYVDSTPTHSYMKYLYKYPQRAYPYEDIVQTNAARTRTEMEYELLDTGVFEGDRYYDIFVEFAKAAPEDILIKISVANRGPDTATLHVLPHLWFRNTWWLNPEAPRPALRELPNKGEALVVEASHPDLGVRYLYAEGAGEFLFTENETNAERLFGVPNPTPYVKDGINDAVVHGRREKVNPDLVGTKAAAHYELTVAPGETEVIRLRLSDVAPSADQGPFTREYEQTFASRKQEADEFYTAITPPKLNADQANVLRQALAGMLWTKQYYYFDLDHWLEEHEANPILGGRRQFRNREWYHMVNSDIISMPDKWEYPWFAAWDLAFHTSALNMVDPDFAENQLSLMLSDLYLHPNGQIPAYEWNFGDVNPPVHAWAALINYGIAREPGEYDLAFLKNTFNKLLLNFNWWVNRKDPQGRNVFSGGFLGLDNIGVFDRSSELPSGGYLDQADGTAWMAFFSQCMLEMAIEIARKDPTYQDFILKFVQHFLWIAGSMDRVGDNHDELWDEEDGFFYDVLTLPDGHAQRLKVRSMVGLLPLTATALIPQEVIDEFPDIADRVRAFIAKHPDLVANIHPLTQPGVQGRRLLAVVNEDKLRRILARMLDEERFLSPYGIRSLSRWHLEHPYQIDVDGAQYQVQYLPGESDSGMFGGNSNWRGPIWMPVNLLLLRALRQFHEYYGDGFKIECPTGSGNMLTLLEVAREIATRLTRIFLQDESGRRAVYGGAEKFQTDPHWRDYILFYEYFHGDSGAGLGASHQTGWTGTVARLLQLLGEQQPGETLNRGLRFN